DKEELLKYNPKPYTREKNIYIAVGKEGPWMERVARELHVKLAKTLPAETSLFFKYLEERDHGDALHLSVYDAFEKIFPQKE
ncbi:MAG: alpha/beta hydrolase, partial [Saprospiraceae bacterium]